MVLGKILYISIEETLKNFIFFTLIGLFLCACSPYNTQITKEYDAQHYIQAYKILQKATKKQSNDWLLWKMQSGFLTFAYFGAHFSLYDLEAAEEQFKIYESKGLLSNAGANVGAILSNDMAIPYRGLIFEGVLLNFYKALAFSSIGDDVQARIEFNRANDRQRRAKSYYHKEIKKARNEAVKEANGKSKSDLYNKSITDSNINDILNTKYTNLSQFAIYRDMINPLIPYVSGLYFMIEQDFSKSVDLLKEAYGISKSHVIAQDMQILESRKGKINYPKFTWIIIEDGDMARKGEFITQIVLDVGSNINSVNLALPVLLDGKPTHTSYRINNKDAQVVSSITNIFASEFQKRLPVILTRALVGALVKFVITQSIHEFGGNYGTIIGLASMATFIATTAADTRVSLVLPNNVWIARIPNTESSVSIYGNNIALLELPITDECNVKSMRIASKENFDSLMKAKPKDLSARIKLFKNYYEYSSENRLCESTDNIVYMRVHRDTVAHTIIKGE